MCFVPLHRVGGTCDGRQKARLQQDQARGLRARKRELDFLQPVDAVNRAREGGASVRKIRCAMLHLNAAEALCREKRTIAGRQHAHRGAGGRFFAAPGQVQNRDVDQRAQGSGGQALVLLAGGLIHRDRPSRATGILTRRADTGKPLGVMGQDYSRLAQSEPLLMAAAAWTRSNTRPSTAMQQMANRCHARLIGGISANAGEPRLLEAYDLPITTGGAERTRPTQVCCCRQSVKSFQSVSCVSGSPAA